jgi:glycosyltransferase involved in cell wall biosynthesis
LSFEEEGRIRASLAGEGIAWEALRYHKSPLILSTCFDIARGVIRCLRLRLTIGVRLLHARGTVPAAIAYLATRFRRCLFLNDADGPLSEEYVDAGVWKRGSLVQRLTHSTEAAFLRSADAVAVLTTWRAEQVKDLARSEVTVLPCAVDIQHFPPNLGKDTAFRAELGLRGRVLVYVGKRSGWYLGEEMLDFVSVAREFLGEVSLLVLTVEDRRWFEESAAARKLPHVVRSVSRSEMPRWLSVGDAGLSFVMPAPSKKSCSPVKNGEYLASGLPIVTTSGVGDYTDLIQRCKVGVVVERLDVEGYRRAARALVALFQDTTLATRCRQTARREVGLSEVVLPRYFHLYESLLGLPSVSP